MNRSRIGHPDEQHQECSCIDHGTSGSVPYYPTNVVHHHYPSLQIWNGMTGYSIHENRNTRIIIQANTTILVVAPYCWPNILQEKPEHPRFFRRRFSSGLRNSCIPGSFPSVADTILGYKVGPAEIVVLQDQADHLAFILDVHPSHQ